jgi:hypothetical protein
MVWVPGCEKHEIKPGPNDPRISPRILVLHVIEGGILGAERRFRMTGIEAHFGVPKSGRTVQWRDTDRQADAQAAGNGYCISFETEGFATERLNSHQIFELVRIGRILMTTYQIPARIVTATDQRGWGYHRQFPEWNPNRHSCPGDLRLQQLRETIIPAFFNKEDDVSQADVIAALNSVDGQRALRFAVDQLMSQGLTGDADGAIRSWAIKLEQTDINVRKIMDHLGIPAD